MPLPILKEQGPLAPEPFYTAAEALELQREAARMLARAAEARDPYTGAHLERMYDYTLALARALGYPEQLATEIAEASQLHDIGKLATPDSILQKAGALTAEEWASIRRHPEDGARILGPSAFSEMARQIVRWHHEAWDGSGYPDGLRGDAIPLHVAIVTVADVFDALTSARPYKPAWTPFAAIDELVRLRGSRLHPLVVDAFIRLYRGGR